MIHLKSILIFAFLVFAVALFAAKSPHGRSLKMDCNVCHTTSGWTEINETGFNHNATRFQLKGQHKLVKCKECHLDLVFENAKTTCNSCHQDVHEQTLGVDCDRCHNENSWLVNNIKQLHQASGFPLSGVHATVECNECHISSSDLRFDKMGNDCFSCHRDDFQATINPNHAAAGFSINCTECHNQNATNWSGPIYDHSFFPLTNAHKLDCKSCHASGVYKGLPSTCESCHLTDYNTTTNPNHQQAGYSKDCQTCHTTSTWTGAAVDHSFFPLTNGHQLSCTECHTNGTYQGLQNDCNSCHNKDYATTTNPNHTQAGYTTDCKTCHNTTNWTGATQDHSFFPLTNAHKLDCKSCHASGVYKGLPSTCESCHLTDYNTTTNPNHQQAGYSKDCQTCHTTSTWTGAAVDHSFFPLTNGHQLSCTECHTNGTYQGLQNDCNSCHNKDYAATTNPNHTQAGYTTDCKTCHNTTNWTGATQDHSFFPLTNAHKLDCKSCHASGVYKDLPSTCQSCHLSEYNAATNPPHLSAGYSKECQLCHNTNLWTDANLNHDAVYFPIYSGSHKGEWSKCTDCHTNASNYNVFTCTNCHEHSKSEMDDEHDEVNNYVYNSANCYACHPRGKS